MHNSSRRLLTWLGTAGVIAASCLSPLAAMAQTSAAPALFGATGVGAAPTAAQIQQLQANPALVQQLRANPALVEQLKANPGLAKQMAAGQAQGAADAGKTDKTAASPNPEQQTLAPLQANDFQTFVAQSTGVGLPMFGASLFNQSPATFAPVQNIPPTADYAVGPGDELKIRVWGAIDADFDVVVDREGQINLPKVGTFSIAGIKAGDLNAFVRSKLGRMFRNFDLDVSLGQMRSIQVYVVGHARRPGTYTLSNLATLVNAVFASGGPSATGSMRHIELKRGGQIVADLDLYNFINKGDSGASVRLQPGDVIDYQAVGPMVAVLGTVNTPAIYELKTPTVSVADILALGGGLPITANTHVAALERINPNASTARSVAQITLDAKGQATALRNGDVLRVFDISPKFADVVTLRGNVASPMRVHWTQGMHVRDLIPNRDALIVPGYYVRNNQLTLQAASGTGDIQSRVRNTADTVDWNYAVVERLNPETLTTHLIAFNLGRALAGDPADNLALEPGDVITVFSQNDLSVPQQQRTRLVTIQGEVNAAGVYQLSPGETLRQAVLRAGGITRQAYLYGTVFTREDTRRLQQQRLNLAITEVEAQLQREAATQLANMSASENQASQMQALQIQQQLQLEQLQRLKSLHSSGRIALELNTDASSVRDLPDVPLEDGDTITIPARNDFVMAVGEVNNENAVLWKPGRSVGDLLAAAGPTRDADLDQAFVIRADGTVINASADHGWLFGTSFKNTLLEPSDTLVVPGKIDHRTAWTNFISGFKDWTQIIYQLGLGAAAFKALGL